MEIIEGLANLNRVLIRPVVCVGNFDGVHLGHQALLGRVVSRARQIKGTAVALTFHPHPVRVLNPAGGPPLLTVKARKEELLAQTGLDILLNIQFTRQFASLSARDFVNKILIQKIGLAEFVVGYDQSFGQGREGGLELIRSIGQKMGIPIHVIGPVKVGGQPVSSTRAREMIEAGQIEEVMRLLGRPYQILGRVVRGHDRGGRLLGHPTANLRLLSEVVPARGVYAVVVQLADGSSLNGVTNVGLNPTFDDQALSVETFILDFKRDLYGELIRLNFMARLRDEMKFDSSQELAGQIKKDVALTRQLLSRERA
ncbi:MAG: bifunctional riboflavin kinase/FAD synthetase [Deltaproteobacteria bacterium]|nr:bifunctional riboflavin kinase/FAD synthetase [Deltaproteobacteria bacterium]